jgi:hypothetical protein
MKCPIKLLFLVSLPIVGLGCAMQPLDHTRREILYEQGKVQKFAYAGDAYGSNRPGESQEFLQAIDILRDVDPSVLPHPADLPTASPKQARRKYVGLIQNFTNYDISIPSDNSGATLIVPAQGWLEYINWGSDVRLKGFVNGKQVYYQSLKAQPGKFKYMGNKYDFMAEIQAPPEPVPEAKPYCPPKRKLKKRPRKRICPA